MKVRIRHIGCGMNEPDKQLAKDFIKFLQKHIKLHHNVTINFLGQKQKNMTTGSRTDDSVLNILVKGRMNRDVLRTLAHEWTHEYQRVNLGRKQGPDIGGKNEDEANAMAGRLMKMFEKEHPEKKDKLYEKAEKLVSLINENNNINYNTELLIEMKKIGIEKLPYTYSALKRFIDEKTMNIHYNKHYKGYVDKLNKALSKKDFGDLDLEEIIRSIGRFPKDIRNNAGGAFNHAMFWKMLSPTKQECKGELLKQIKKDFGSYIDFKNKFEMMAKKRFGSGWVWLVMTKRGVLKVMSTPNQDNPLMNVINRGGYPILGLDLWEHAYYLKYQNKRDEYIKNFWDVVNWEFVDKLYQMKKKTKLNESLVLGMLKTTL